MRYQIPDIALLADAPDARERLGGLPFGLDPAKWPKCSDCGKSQSLLAQLQHDPERLDLGRAGRSLLIFQCAHDPGMCSTWEVFSGANACLVVEPEGLSDHLTDLPADEPPLDNPVAIIGWIEREDGLGVAEYSACFEADSFFALPEETLRKITFSTRLGGAPCWIQSPDEAPKPDWRFLGQLDGFYSFMRPPTGEEPWISVDNEQFEGRTHFAEGPNLGDGGIAYVFLREGPMPEVAMFWQCG